MSGAQTHRVLRLVIELAGASQAQAAALQTALRQRFVQDWLPAIERICDALGQPGRVQRIDRLLIDLGVVPAPALRHEAGVAPFEAQFAGQLAQALRTAPDADSDLELVDFYLHTGALPWWADSADRLTVQNAVRALLQNPSPGWLALVGGLASGLGDQPCRRLMATLDDGLLARLLDQQLGAGPGAAPGSTWPVALHAAWPQVLGLAAGALALPAHRLRTAWWQAVLAAALPGAAATLDRWLPAALAGMAGGLGITSARLQQALRQALDGVAAGADAPGLAPLRAVLARPGPATGADLPPARIAAAPAAAAGAVANGLLAAVAGAGAGAGAGAAAAAAQQGPPTAADAVPAASPRRPGLAVAEPVGQPAPAATPAATPAANPAPAGAETGPGSTLHRLISPAAAAQPSLSIAHLPSGAGAHLPSAAGAHLPSAAAAHLPRRTAAVQHHPVDALYLANAGLVLLWPFIPRFVEHLGLSVDGGWHSPATAQRAARLLQCVASGDADPPEFQLPLNKLLCGLPLDDALLDDVPLTEPEQAECSALLVAVIAQAPILREMSVAGFRASFLARPGQLSSRDGHWLLRVERQTYDVVIDRFPWGFGIVRLPWMATLLQVQW